MNLKIAHLVTVQFGILVGIVACLVFSRFEYAKPRTAAEMQAAKRTAALEPLTEPEDQRADRVDRRAESERAQLPPGQLAPVVPNEYSAAAVEQYRALATKLYYEQIAPRRNASSNPATSSMAAVAQSYSEVAQEPAVIQTDDPAPQTVAYVQPTQDIVYSQPAQFVVFSNRRPFVNRCRPTPHSGADASGPHRRPDRGGTHWNGSPGSNHPRSLGVEHRRNSGGPSCPPTQGFRPRGKR